MKKSRWERTTLEHAVVHDPIIVSQKFHTGESVIRVGTMVWKSENEVTMDIGMKEEYLESVTITADSEIESVRFWRMK